MWDKSLAADGAQEGGGALSGGDGFLGRGGGVWENKGGGDDEGETEEGFGGGCLGW